MNKTLKTVLITLAVTCVILFAVVMIFGKESPAPTDSTTPEAKNASVEVAKKTVQSASEEVDETIASSTEGSTKGSTEGNTKNSTEGNSKTNTAKNSKSNSKTNTASNSKSNTAAASSAPVISMELYETTISYDIFDWNGADEQGKIEMAKNILFIWSEAGDSCELSAKELAAYISQNLHDQANVFEVACIAAQIDPQQYSSPNN